jgi:uroporphyrinogen-III synthase
VNRPLLILRPEPGNSATLAAAQALGLDVLSYPLFAVRPLDWDAPDAAGYTGLLLTSANAVRMAGANLAQYADVPVFAVGSATAKAAQAAGLSNIVIGSGGVEAVLELAGPGRLLHLCGLHVTDAGVTNTQVDRRAVYVSDEGSVSGLSHHLANAPVVLLHSSRAAARLAALVEQRSTIALAALSFAVAEAAGTGWQVVAIADKPNDEALLNAAIPLTRS